MKISCEVRRRELHCDQLFQHASPEERANFYSCENKADVCEQITSSTVSRLYSCGKGIAQGVLIDPVVGIYHLGTAIWEVAAGRADLPQIFKECPEDLEAKKIILGGLRPGDMSDEALGRMACADVKKFTQRKAEVILEKLEQKRQNEMALKGKENLDVYDMNLTEAEKQALDYDNKQVGLVGKSRCFRPEVAANIACHEMAGDVTAISGTIGLSRMGAKLVRKFEAKTAKVTEEVASAKPLAKIDSVTPNSQEVYAIDITKADGTVVTKNIRFLPKDSWGLPENFKGKVYDATLTVQSREEGYEIFKDIVAKGPPEWKASEISPLVEGRNAFELPNKMEAYIATPQSGHMVGQRAQELVISFPKTSDGPQEAANLIKGLNGAKLRKDPTALATMDLSSVGSKSEWAKYSFEPWAKSLSGDERIALVKLGDGNYKAINSRLRGGTYSPESQLPIDKTIRWADEALAKGKVNRDITTYRSDSSPYLQELWDKVKKEGVLAKGASLKSDPAYTFTSIDADVAKWWNKTELKDKGVLLQIEVPKGSSAGYLDSAGVHKDRGYMELVLPRNSKFDVTGISEAPNGQKILKVRLKP